MSTDIEDRVRALERAITERDDPAGPIPDIAEVDATATDLDERVSELESLVADLAARQEAVEAYVDRIEHVNESIERRADAALAAVDRLETRRERHPAQTPGSDSEPESRPMENAPAEQSERPNPGSTHASHVRDAATVGTATEENEFDNENEDSGAEGLLARFAGL